MVWAPADLGSPSINICDFPSTIFHFLLSQFFLCRSGGWWQFPDFFAYGKKIQGNCTDPSKAETFLQMSNDSDCVSDWPWSSMPKIFSTDAADMAKDTINCLKKAMKISHFNHIMIELCYFSLHRWEIKIHMLSGKCFNIPHWLRSHATNGRLQHIDELSKTKTRVGIVTLI